MNEMLYQPVKTCVNYTDYREVEDAQKQNLARIEEIEKAAIARGGLLHRFIYESVADGKSIYQIIKVNKKTVQVHLCPVDGLYSDYVVPYWGMRATIPIEYAEKSIRAQDTWRRIMEERGAPNV